jgi:hypothetical protein
MTRADGGESVPGTLYIEEITHVEPEARIDLHVVLPARALGVAKALGALPRTVWIVGCEPAELDELIPDLSPAVAAALDDVVHRIRGLLVAGTPRPADAPIDLARRDEVLQVMFWLAGEGLGPHVAASDICRFTGDEPAVATVLAHLVAEGYAERDDGGGGDARYRLTPLGEIEGRRRFLDEFEPYLARATHGECGNADCDCRRGGECRSR